VDPIPILDVSPRSRWSEVEGLLRPHQRRVALVATSSFLGGLVEAAFLVVITRVVLTVADAGDRIEVVPGQWSASTGEAIVAAAILVVIRLALALTTTSTSARLIRATLSRIRVELAESYVRASWSVQQSEPPHRLQELLTSFSLTAASAISALTWGLTAALNLSALLLVSVVINPVATLLVALTLGVLGGILGPARSRIRSHSERSARAQLGFASQVGELGSLAMDMHTAGVQDEFSRRLATLIDVDAEARRRTLTVQSALPPIYTFIGFGAIVAGLAITVALDATDQLVGLGAVMLVMVRALTYGQQAQSGLSALLSALPFLDALRSTVTRYDGEQANQRAVTIERIGTIELEHVSFEYVEGQPILRDISFRIEPGELVGITGPSASGKSTLLELLIGLREPTSGHITVAGTDLCNVQRTRWCHLTGFVAQDPMLLSGTLNENVAFLREGLGKDHVETALQRAQLAADVATMPDGVDTAVSDHGNRLSGGQRQRLVIARALAANPQLLIMDEPTSAMDARTEALIQSTVLQLRGTATVLIVSHRASTLAVCDRVLIMDEGQLLDSACVART
jgi:ATP-binding cassette, subfamily B, bacterial